MVNIRDNITLKACRIIVGATASELARELNISVDTVYKWERGESYPNAPQMVKIVNFFAGKGYYIDINDINFFNQ